MGNTLAYESHSSSPDGDKTYMVSLKGPSSTSLAGRPLLQRKGSSFLDEPVTHKLTERGETAVTLGSNAENASDEGGRQSSSDKNEASAKKLRYAVSEMQGWRSHMEDKHALNPTLSTNRQQVELLNDHHLFAVFDGHGGDFASHYCGEHFVSTLTSQKDWLAYLKLDSNSNRDLENTKQHARESVTGLQLLKSALTSTFLALDDNLLSAQRTRRLEQLAQLETLVFSLGGTVEHDVFHKGTKDHEKILNFDKQLPASMPANVPLERSGSTGVVVLVTPHHIICANAGDSRAILSKNKNEVLPLSFDHKPTNDVEVTRVEKDGGFVRAGRVDGDLAVSRSFGDFGYKFCNDKDIHSSSSPRSNPIKIPSEPKDHRVTVQPDILVHTREPNKDEFLVLACDGIWDRLTNRDCSDLVRTLINDESETDAGLICEEVIDTSLELDSRDNMTCLLVVFPGANMSTEVTNNTASSGGVMRRRLERERSWGHDSTPAKRALRRLDERRTKHREVLALNKAKMAPKAQPVRAQPVRAQPVRRQSSRLQYQQQQQQAPGLKIEEPKAVLKKHKATNESPPRAANVSGRVRSTKSLRIQGQF